MASRLLPVVDMADSLATIGLATLESVTGGWNRRLAHEEGWGYMKYAAPIGAIVGAVVGGGTWKTTLTSAVLGGAIVGGLGYTIGYRDNMLGQGRGGAPQL
jgi:hypothetical protein